VACKTSWQRLPCMYFSQRRPSATPQLLCAQYECTQLDYENPSHHTSYSYAIPRHQNYNHQPISQHHPALSLIQIIIHDSSTSAIHAASTTCVSPLPGISRYMTATLADSSWLQPRIPSLRGVCGASPGPVACPTPRTSTPSHRQPSSATSPLPSSPHSKIPSSFPRV
jgi:hypothetical protein